jgi:hypothetical protein
MKDNIMKKILSMFNVLIGISTAVAQTNQPNFFTNVTNLWYQGYKTNVLAIAQQRLNTNSNDIAGLLLVMEWEEAAGDNDSLSNACQRVIEVGATISTPHFSAIYFETKTNAMQMLEFLTEYHPSPSELAADKVKGLLPFKPLCVADEIEALQKDGYFK